MARETHTYYDDQPPGWYRTANTLRFDSDPTEGLGFRSAFVLANPPRLPAPDPPYNGRYARSRGRR